MMASPVRPIRILIADDHPMARAGLGAMLGSQPDLALVGEAATGLEALHLAHALHPDLVLMDLRMPELDGVGATARLRAELPAVRVLVLTTYDSDADILRAVEAGAAGYLLKDAAFDQLFSAVRAVARGERRLAPAVAEKLERRHAQGTPESLTPRELEVLACVAEGLSNKRVAARLGLMEPTVKSHLLRVFEKLQVEGRTAAVMVALERGLLTR